MLAQRADEIIRQFITFVYITADRAFMPLFTRGGAGGRHCDDPIAIGMVGNVSHSGFIVAAFHAVTALLTDGQAGGLLGDEPITEGMLGMGTGHGLQRGIACQPDPAEGGAAPSGVIDHQ